MIKKEHGNPCIHGPRVINLYKANYNLILGIFWAHKLVPQAERLCLFNSSCYGSRPGLSVVDPVLLKELKVLILYLSCTNQVIFHNDATFCYDRIIISLENLVVRQFGMPAEFSKHYGATLEQMKDYVSMALGLSGRSDSHSDKSPIYGTGQGSCASLSVWLEICCVLFDCHNQRSYGVNCTSPGGSVSFKTSMTGFADDKKGQTNNMASTYLMPLQELISQMLSDVQLWGNLLHVSGGGGLLKSPNVIITL
jgi:hypothetical protein